MLLDVDFKFVDTVLIFKNFLELLFALGSQKFNHRLSAILDK